jgi:hypothetical protein
MNKLCRARAVPSASILHVIRSPRTPFEQMNMLELLHTRLRIPGPPGPGGEVGAGGQRARVLRARDPLAHRQQRGVLVPGPGRVPRLPGPAGELVPGGQRVRVLRAKDPLLDGQQRGVLVAGRGRVPRLPGPAGQLVPGEQGARVLRAKDPLVHGQQRGVLVAGRGRVPRLPGPAGQLVPGEQGARVLRAKDPLLDGQQPGVPVPGRGRVPRLPGPAGQLLAGGQGVRVLRAKDPLLDGQQPGKQIPGRGRVPRVPGPAGELVPGGVDIAEMRGGAVERQLRLQVSEENADAERLAALTGYLRSELLQLEVENVSAPLDGIPPPGSRAVSVASVGGLLVTLGQSAQSLNAVISVVSAWLRRGRSSSRAVRLELENDRLELSQASTTDQERLIELFISRHSAEGGDL